jgi:uncharacterized protein with NAD-binding domain and iron-sulfur cluster
MPKRSGGPARELAADNRPIRVVIVGGGCAGLAAAWELTQRNVEQGHRRYEVTVYEQSWMLGGKGASVRDKEGRILEHGLHVWLGFYENAFQLMRQCFDELRAHGLANGPFDSIDKAFFPESHLGAALRDRHGDPQAWTGHFPAAKGEPGTPLDADSNPFTLPSYVGRLLAMLKTLLLSVVAPPAGETWRDARARWGYTPPAGSEAGIGERVRSRPDGRSTLDSELGATPDDDPGNSADLLVERLAQLVRLGALASGAGLMQAMAILETLVQQESALAPRQFAFIDVVEAIAKHTRRLLADFVTVDDALRRRTEIIDLVITIVVGLFRDKVLFAPNGLEAIDDIDCREWLIKHGATYEAANSAFVRGLYDLAFAYRDGNKQTPALAAGQALRGALRMFFTYRGAIVWRMRGGMGEVIFSPLYRALLQRGVTFRFNHRLNSVTFNDDLGEKTDNHVAALTFTTAHRTQPRGDDGRPPESIFWPPGPQAWFGDPGPTRRVKLAAGRERQGFDAVVLAIGKDDFVAACGPLCEKLAHYRRMKDHVATVGTQAVQFWLRPTLEELGWKRGPVIMTGIDGPLDSWADMAHVLAAERDTAYAGGQRPQAAVYLCGVLPDPPGDKLPACELQRQADIAVRDNARAFLERRDLLKQVVGPVAGSGFEQQHFQANVVGSARYALSLPGTLEHRISPLDDAVFNMTIAGDWTDCGFNEGCVEAAVMSGRLAAHALDGQRPSLDEIVGYNHP